jgi:hypothetical protein
MTSPDKQLITVVDGPTVDGNRLHSATTGIIYSVILANGMVVTSPERFAPEPIQSERRNKPEAAQKKRA